ncbi:MAG: reverse transcriptase family protein [Cyanobacteria bacterium J06582_2]
MLFTESHLNDSAKEKEFHIPNYSSICCNRKNRSHGGVIIYLHNHLSYKILCNASDEMCSLLSIYINELKLIIFLAYRPPPDYDHANQYHGTHLESSFSNIIINNVNNIILNFGAPTPDIILAGDFNFPNAKWCEGTSQRPQGNSPESLMLCKLINTCESHNLLQKINFGTRNTLAGNSNILDLIFTNNHQLITSISHQQSTISDHNMISCTTAYNHPLHINSGNPNPTTPTTLSSFNLNRANFVNITNSFNQIDWQELFQNKNSSECIEILESQVLKTLELNCPKFTSRPGQSNSKIPRARRILFRQRKRKRKLMESLNPLSPMRACLERDIKQLERNIDKLLKDERLHEETKAINNIKSNPKHFYSFARKHQIVKGGIGPLRINNTLINSPHEICEQLSSQYSSVFSPPNPNQAITDPSAYFNISDPSIPSLTDIHFSPQMIEEEINTIKNNSAPGPDHFPATLLKSCKKNLSTPIYMIWRKSLDDNEIGQTYLHAIICPALKPGSESYHPKSYRPISLTSHIIKIFEKIMRKAIISHLERNNLLPTNQHGFLNGRSTLSQLLSQTENIIRVLENGNDLDSIYLDFSKAFDKVDHSILCAKLKSLGIGGKVGSWLHTFLTKRTQQVSANGALSKPSPVLSGVPQGTVLGPILFIIMISDIDKNLERSFASLFADDSRLSAVIASERDSESFQDELDNVTYPWATNNKATFNGDKFEHIHFGKKIDIVHSYQDPQGHPILTKNHIKDLGILISNDLNWSPHINKIISDCRKQVAWILRTFSKRDIDTMRTLWISLIRPIIDYCSPLWSPNPTNYGNIDRLEGILRSYSKHVDGLNDKTYCERLKAMKLHSIQRRHERYKILYIYKIKEGLVPNLPPNPFNPAVSYAIKFSKTLRHGTRCSIPNPVLYHNPAEVPRSSSFALTATNLWNCLHPEISSISNVPVPSFKKQLDKFLDLFPDEPRCSASGRFSDPNTGRTSNSIWHMRFSQYIRLDIRNFSRGVDSQSIAREGLNEVIPHP